LETDQRSFDSATHTTICVRLEASLQELRRGRAVAIRCGDGHLLTLQRRPQTRDNTGGGASPCCACDVTPVRRGHLQCAALLHRPPHQESARAPEPRRKRRTSRTSDASER